MGDYTGKRVVVTGGSSGIGLATAQLLADGGARVLVTGRSQETLDQAKAALGEAAVTVRGDVASTADLDTLAGAAERSLGGIDLLFVNAGLARWAPFAALDEQTYDELLDVNVKGAFFTVQKLLPMMAEGSSVVLTTSVVNVKGFPGASAYAASKAALRSLARSMARELLPRGIRVNAVSPGPIETDILYKVMPRDAAGQAMEQMKGNNPMARLGRPDEVARAVAFLAFEATYTTGAELPVDGGLGQL